MLVSGPGIHKHVALHMSAFGPKRTSASSAFWGKADPGKL